jgi:hypothetical protein
MKKLLGFAVLAASLGSLAVPASAVIVAGTVTGGNILGAGGTFVKTNATLNPNIGVNLIDGLNIYGLDENQNGVLTNATRLWSVTPLTAGAVTANIGIGTKVASHLIFLDAPGGRVRDPITASGTITFHSKILGYRAGQTMMAQTDASLGGTGITYGILRPLESANDTLSFSGRTLTYSFSSPAATADFVRVITAVPEPTTWSLLLVGFAMVGLAARRRPRTVAA